MTTKPSTQSGDAVPEKKTTAVDRGVGATEEQARAIISTAKKAVEEAAKTKTRADCGKQPSSSLKRSLECFLEGRRKNKPAASSAATRHHLETSTTASSSSSSCH